MTCSVEYVTLKGIRGRYGSRASIDLEEENSEVLPALIVEAYPHLGSGLDDKSDEKPLPRKADESMPVLDRKLETTEGITVLLRQKIRLGDSNNDPKSELKYTRDFLAITNDYKYK